MRPSLFLDVTQRMWAITDVVGEPIGPNFKDKAVQEVFLDCFFFFVHRLTHEDGTDRMSENIGN
jgi:hypothetical protein